MPKYKYTYSQPLPSGTPVKAGHHSGRDFIGFAGSKMLKYSFAVINGKQFELPFNITPDGEKVIDWLPENARIYKSIPNPGGVCWIAKDAPQAKFVYLLDASGKQIGPETSASNNIYDYCMSQQDYCDEPPAFCIGDAIMFNGQTVFIPAELQLPNNRSILGCTSWDGDIIVWTTRGVYNASMNEIIYLHVSEPVPTIQPNIMLQTMVIKFIAGYVHIGTLEEKPDPKYEDYYYTVGTKYRIKITKKIKKNRSIQIYRECCICLEYMPRMMAYDCGHMVVCQQCDTSLAEKNNNNCPICRTVIVNRLPVILN